MNQKRNFIVGIFLGLLIGWTLGFLRLPDLGNSYLFWVGFAACIAVIFLFLFMIFLWNKNTYLLQFLAGNSENIDGVKEYRNLWLLISLFILFGGFAGSFLINQQTKIFNFQIKEQNQKIDYQSKLIESVGRSNFIVLLNNVLGKVADELDNNPRRVLSDETIGRIAILNQNFQPYAYSDEDTLRLKKISAERGQLLTSLVLMNIAIESFDKIKKEISFSGADLRGADLSGADLSAIDLRSANLSNAILNGAKLSDADLRDANLWGAFLNNADLVRANLMRANLQWVKMNQATLDSARLNGANLSSAGLRNANLEGASLKWTILQSADFRSSNLRRVDFFGADLKEANLSKTLLGGALVGKKNWLQKLAYQNVTGAKGIEENYKIVEDSTAAYSLRIKRIDD